MTIEKIRSVRAPRLTAFNVRTVAIDRMKLEAHDTPEWRESFAGDVETILDTWSPSTPLLWFSGVEGTALVDVGAGVSENEARAVRWKFERVVKEHPTWKLYMIEVSGEVLLFQELQVSDARAALGEYYRTI